MKTREKLTSIGSEVLGLVKGFRAVRSTYRVTPRAHQSTLMLYPRPQMLSGETVLICVGKVRFGDVAWFIWALFDQTHGST